MTEANWLFSKQLWLIKIIPEWNEWELNRVSQRSFHSGIENSILRLHLSMNGWFQSFSRHALENTDWPVLADSWYSSVSKSQSQYRPFRVVIFVTRSQSPPDPQETLTPHFRMAAYPRKADSWFYRTNWHFQPTVIDESLMIFMRSYHAWKREHAFKRQDHLFFKLVRIGVHGLDTEFGI